MSTPSPADIAPRVVASDPMTIAKRVVVANFNEHRKSRTVPELQMKDVFIVWFTKTLMNWKAIIASSQAKGLFWEVSYNGVRKEIYLDVYTKINNVKISMEDLQS